MGDSSMKSTPKSILRDLGDGLVMRRATMDDLEALSAFNASVHSDEGFDKPDGRIGAWTRDLIEKPHPTYSVGDFTLVEDTHTGKIVSSLNLISQTWSYAGVEFGVGRPELVGTHPDYRNRGLVRAQFEVVHQWSAERGELLQAITGIPYYYRLFGYEMAVCLDGGRAGYPLHIPRLKEDEKETYLIRQAILSDIPFMMELYELGTRRSLLACRRDEAIWNYQLEGKSQSNVNRMDLFIVENQAGQPMAFFGTPPFTWGDIQVAQAYEVKPGVSWSAVTPVVIRFLENRHAELSAHEPNPKPFGAFGFWLGEDHPVYHVIPSKLPFKRRSYTWYLRVPDLPAFIRKISPVLESRLEASYIPGYSGQLELTFYKGGLRMVFDQGKLSLVENYKPGPVGYEGNAGFPGLSFLQLLFGHRSLDELQVAFTDCFVRGDEALILLQTLFPRQLSNIWPVS
jgi:hypothetical protein